jgi:hypothetical protein
MIETTHFTRRTLVAAAFAAAAAPAAWAQALRPDGRLVFSVARNGRTIGRHSLVFSGGAEDFSVAIDAAFRVGLGPLSLFDYRLLATETWRGGRFAALQSHTITNGKRDQVSAVRRPGGVAIQTLSASHTLPPEAMPLTHWSQRAFDGPIFNPQTGALMRETVARAPGQTLRVADGRSLSATRYALTGEAEITDWYDEAGVWVSLRAKAQDGSVVDYHRLA